MVGSLAAHSIPGSSYFQESREGKIPNNSESLFGDDDFPRLKGAGGGHGEIPSFGKKGAEILDWSSLYSKKNKKDDAPLIFKPLKTVDGEQLVALDTSDFKDETKLCENLVIGFFVGHRLPFWEVQKAIPKAWKIHSEVKIKIYGENAFIFDFIDDDERKSVLDQGISIVAGRMFVVRPWNPLIEQSVAEMKTIPVWVRIFNVPLHFWNKLGLSSIASFIGKPLMADDITMNKTRLSYARICIEVGIDCNFPTHIPILIDNSVKLELPVEYQWKPPKCTICSSFGHSLSNCPRKSQLITPQWAHKASQQVHIVEKSGTGVIEVPKEGYKAKIPCNKDVEANLIDKDNEMQGKTPFVQDKNASDCEEGEFCPDREKVTVVKPFDYDGKAVHQALNQKKKVKNGSVVHPAKQGGRTDSSDLHGVGNAQAPLILEGASTSSSDPSIPPGFGPHSSSKGHKEDKEVVSSQQHLEDAENSFTKQSSFSISLGSIRDVSSKSKATGMFPIGTLSSKKNKGTSKRRIDTNSISVKDLKEFGSIMGLDFPVSKNSSQQLLINLKKSHKGLIIEGVEEN